MSNDMPDEITAFKGKSDYYSSNQCWLDIAEYEPHDPIDGKPDPEAKYTRTDIHTAVVEERDRLRDALENLWKSCIPKDQTVVGRIHLDHAQNLLKELGKIR